MIMSSKNVVASAERVDEDDGAGDVFVAATVEDVVVGVDEE